MHCYTFHAQCALILHAVQHVKNTFYATQDMLATKRCASKAARNKHYPARFVMVSVIKEIQCRQPRLPGAISSGPQNETRKSSTTAVGILLFMLSGEAHAKLHLRLCECLPSLKGETVRFLEMSICGDKLATPFK